MSVYDEKENANLIANKMWDKQHEHYERKNITYDNWLDSFEDIINNCQTPILDLGCGSGNDTLYLIERGKKVIACDYSKNAINNIKNNFPEIMETKCFDLTKGLPFSDNYSDVIICDLSIHYFTEEITFKVLADIKRVLRDGGHLFLRVNSTKDVNHGAGEGNEIEHHLYKTEDGRYKRFFDEDDINKFFYDWEKVYIHEEVMNRYLKEKVLWELAFKK